MERRVRVALVFGGRSSEHAVSCSTAASVMDALDPDAYELIPVGITREGQWVLMPPNPEQLRLTASQVPEVGRDPGVLALALDTSREIDAHAGALAGVDVVFPLLHGPFGEDGTLQGLLELLDIPYVGSGVFASAAMQDKQHMRTLLAAKGFPVGAFETITDKDWRRDPDAALARCERLRLPVFVKPSRSGSSVGVHRVKDWAELRDAVETAREHDPKVLVEEGIHGREIECGVLEGRDGARPRTTVPGQVVVTGRDFYDFDAKYLDAEAARLVIPADLPDAVSAEIRRLAAEAFEAMDCEGLARVDFYYTDDGDVLVNELNTMPGFTPTSMFPLLWQHSGLSYPELVSELIQLALSRRIGLR
jgi:D-alanine-D-alanine ligase